MKQSFFRLGLLFGMITADLFFLPPPARALQRVWTSDMVENERATEGLQELVAFLGEAGLRVSSLQTPLPHLMVHEEGAQAAGVLLADDDDGLTVTTGVTRYNGAAIIGNDNKTHLIFRKATIDDLVERDFVSASDNHSPLAAAVHELLRASIFYSKCVHRHKAEEESLLDALTAHIAMRVDINELFLSSHTAEARQAQADLTALVSAALTTNPAWEQCYADLGHLLVSIDFDTLPTGTLVPEGMTLTDQYLAKGVIFDIADTLAPPDILKIDDASFEIERFFLGMSLPNVLTNRGFAPGPFSSLGCGSNLRVTFVDPVTKLPAPVSSVSIRWFAGTGDPTPTALPIRLIARDLRGRVIATDEFQLKALFFAPANFSLRVSKGKRKIASVETQGVTGGGICTAFDNLAFWPPVQ
ncbi:MAG TPA: hypothetical protein VNN62_05245 [Methylomirabilota bacterium]|jgi:hypothetical protein|nr:hypothetical protein [Methylomirabilota bacterium]